MKMIYVQKNFNISIKDIYNSVWRCHFIRCTRCLRARFQSISSVRFVVKYAEACLKKKQTKN